MNSGKWQINRAGLVDFWYYDEETFECSEGRMLLRGSNGSGKSVTMQSFIPLLLDGNMRPERLDPFGSRARKMENYLLEENDDRDERTGYLYMEFKRLGSEEYLTLGLGIRARKNKKLESWYFCIMDNRRVGYDIFLYKDLENKITCSKIELKNRIGDGGKVMETQSEYAACVNRLLFGFETQEEYKELLELLIQLRTPKLSKDFKPTVINEILSSSLQTLSEDDLRPMSEAIENMDNLKTNLDSLNESIRGARQIEKIYDQYNRIVLYNKARMFAEAGNAYEDCDRAGKKQLEELNEKTVMLEKEKQRYQELAREEEVLKKEKESLTKSDAAKLKEQELELTGELREKAEEKCVKERQEQEKKDKLQETERRLKRGEEENERIWGEIETCIEEMEDELEDVPFDEFSFLKKELLEDKNPDYSFESHVQLLKRYTEQAERGKEGLTEEKNCQEKYDRYLKELDLCQAERNGAEREVQQYERLLQETKAELTEQVYLWERSNEELSLTPDVMQEISRKIQGYEQGSDYSEIRELAKQTLYEKESEFTRERMLLEQEMENESGELQRLEEELTEWKTQKEPEPEQPECVQKNRSLLKEKGIPYQQFYKTIEFGTGMESQQADRLEEALQQMGILDALIISEEYRDKVLELDCGVCDRYIFGDVSHVRENLTKVLDVDNGENDILFYQKISGILASIGFGRSNDPGRTWIDERGNYRLGVLEGTVTGEYHARFIGIRAREQYRKEKIEELETLCHNKMQQVETIKAALEKNGLRLELLWREWEKFPKDEDLKTAAKELAGWEYRLELAVRRLGEQQALTETERKKLDEIRIKVRELCAKCYLSPRLDLFVSVLESLHKYKDLLAGLRVSYGNYQNGVLYVKSQQEYRDDIEQDLDDIRYDLSRISIKVRELEEFLVSVRKQLELTDYEQIRERLDYCMQRLILLPGERESCVGRQNRLENEAAVLQDKIRENETKKEQLSDKKETYGTVFKLEYGLGYTEDVIEETDDMDGLAKAVCGQLSGSCGNKKQEDVFGSLQEVYHQNRGFLLDYQITLSSLFEDLNDENSFLDMSAKRIDISAKYRGTAVKFKELLQKLCEDADGLAKVLSERDRELFEDILANTISKKIRARIQASKRWVEKMNGLMESMQTSSGLRLSLRWKNKRAEKEEQLDTRALVELLQKDAEIMRPEEIDKISQHFRSKIEEARKLAGDTGAVQSFHATMREVLDYRKWFEFQLECQKTGEKKKELTDRVFFTFSGGEKAMSMYVPLFSAVAAKYAGAREDAPKMISLDEAFAGVDEMNIRDMFRLIVEFEFNFMINSQILWGDYDTVPALAIYQLIRPENARFVSVIRYLWNGKKKVMVTDQMAQKG